MKIFVCAKQVPDSDAKIKVAADGNQIDPNGIKWILNPYDAFAIEEAVKLKEANPGSTITVFTLGPKKRVSEILITAIAMGADEGVVVDSGELTLDSFASAKALTAAINTEGSFDLLLTGKVAVDDNQGAVPSMIAQMLSIPHAGVVSKLQVAGNVVTAQRDADGGTKEIVQMTGPCLVSANKGLNMPRYASLPGIMKAKKKVLKELDLPALGVSAVDVRAMNVKLQLPPEKPPAKILSGDLSAQITELVRLLRDEAKAL